MKNVPSRRNDVGRAVEVTTVGGPHITLAQCQRNPLPVVRELVNLMGVSVDHSDVPLRIVGAHLDRVGHPEKVVPLRPVFDDLPVLVENEDEVAVRTRLTALGRAVPRRPRYRHLDLRHYINPVGLSGEHT
jgi:hypothetical protein